MEHRTISHHFCLYCFRRVVISTLDRAFLSVRYKIYYKLKRVRFNVIHQWTLVSANKVFNEFLVILNKISRSLHFWLWKLSYKTSIERAPLLTNSSIYRTNILVSSSKFIMDSTNSIIIWRFEVYLQLLNHWNLSEFPMHAFVRNLNSNHFHSNAKSFQITLQLHCNCILWKMTSLKRKRLSLSEK